MQALIDFLGLTKYGRALLEFKPNDDGPTRYGSFDDVSALTAACEDYRTRGDLLLHLQPTHLPATNRLSLLEPPPAAPRFANVGLQIYKPDDGDADSGTVASRLADRMGNTMFIWRARDTRFVLAGVPPFEPADDLDEALRRLVGHIQRESIKDWPDVTVDLASRVPLNDGEPSRALERIELAGLARTLHRPIPPRVFRELTKRSSLVARLFRGDGNPGFDEHGRRLEPSPENFDRAFIDALIEKGYSDDNTLIDALWNRPDSAARKQGEDAVRAVVHAALDRMAARGKIEAKKDENDEKVVYPPETPLRDRIVKDYRAWSDRSEREIWRIDIDITTKANKVVDFLIDRKAEFYYFVSTAETVFIVDGVQYLVDIKDPAYQRWFTSNVRLFGPDTGKGKELTAALRVTIQQHDRCHRPTRANWGHFDRAKGILYLCLDPNHARIIRIKPSMGDGRPLVDTLPNGGDNVTLRGPMGRERRFEYREESLQKGWKLFKDEVHGGQALPELERLMSSAFNLTTLIPDHAQRPIKFHRGGEQSGKTSAAKEWDIVQYGRSWLQDFNDKPSFLHALKCGGPMVTQDNVEATTRRKFAQVYLVASTGASHTLRKYYHESMPVVYEPNATICITAIEPMNKPEELRRTFEFEFDATKYGDDAARDQSEHERLLINSSDVLLSAILDVFSLYILPAFVNGRQAEAVQWLQARPLGTKRAFVSWLGWMLMVVEAIGSHLWDSERAGYRVDAHALMDQYIKEVLAAERSARIEGDTALSCLDQIRNDALIDAQRYAIGDPGQPKAVVVHTIRVLVHPDGVVEIGPLTTGDLYKGMSSVSKTHGMRFGYEHGRALGSRLKVLCGDEAFRELGWERSQLDGRAHGNNLRYIYTWTPPNLQTVDEDLLDWEPSPDLPPAETS